MRFPCLGRVQHILHAERQFLLRITLNLTQIRVRGNDGYGTRIR